MEPDIIRLKEIKPALSGYIREAQTLMGQSEFPDDKVVHDVRVLMKKSRATLKLIGSQIEKEALKRDITDLRETGRIMRSWRESTVHRKVLRGFKKVYPEIFLQLEDDEKLTILMSNHESASEASDDIKINLNEITQLLNKTGYRIRFLSMNDLDPASLMKELEATYQSACNSYLKCRNISKAENLHEFRKKSKDFLYQLWFFRPLNTTVVKSVEKKLEMITQNLGKHNDMSQLIIALDYKYRVRRNLPALDQLVVVIRDSQDNYLTKVWPIAYGIFYPGKSVFDVLDLKVLLF